MKNAIIELLIVLFSTLFAYTAGRIQERLNSKYKVNEERYINFYWEFEHIFMLKTHGAFLFSELDLTLKEEFLNILINGYRYANNNLKQKIIEFRWQWDCGDTEPLNNTFNEITRIIFEESNRLSRKLYGRSFKLNYRNN